MFVDLDYKINIIKFMTEKILNRSPLPEEVKNFREKINIGTANKNGGLSDVDKAKEWKLEGEIITNKEKLTNPLQVEARTDTCSFIGAMMEVQEGAKITRVAWGNKEIYGIKKDGFLLLHKDDDKFHHWIISGLDMDAEDWVTFN